MTSTIEHQHSHVTTLIHRHFADQDGELLVGGLSIGDLVQTYGTPLFIYDHGRYKTVHTGGGFGPGPRDESLTIYLERGRMTIWPSPNFLRDIHTQVELVRAGGNTPVVERPVK